MTDQYLDSFWRRFNSPKRITKHIYPKKPSIKERIEYLFNSVLELGNEINYYSKVNSKRIYKVELVMYSGELFFSGSLNGAIKFLEAYQKGYLL